MLLMIDRINLFFQNIRLSENVFYLFDNNISSKKPLTMCRDVTSNKISKLHTKLLKNKT